MRAGVGAELRGAVVASPTAARSFVPQPISRRNATNNTIRSVCGQSKIFLNMSLSNCVLATWLQDGVSFV